ncbi:chemotaxis protein MotB [Tamilnaduibacter salinus]|uniref:Chemotaxis protein MotB n=1 Tax=Tamilnaduibacter salinus TaxID=1484056 RepID=A0A2U1CU68_9GAMM|nr:MotB family protein [Tamilnaduibacter salinus]PVY70303.1 chemotaxis protein MotB [Tamilnaduibacter salinus]
MDDLPEEEKRGTPAWVMTFADLMSLLMCFFVLLLSFSEIDANKFKQIAEEMAKAFGVQRDVPALEIPEGTSPVFKHFSPGKPEPTVLDQVRQSKAEREPEVETNTTQNKVSTKQEDALKEKVDTVAESARKRLDASIQDGRVSVEEGRKSVTIRVEEKGSFASGSSRITFEFEELLYRMAKILEQIPGDLTVEGHTDNVPISTARYRSNWNLSADRAATVGNALIKAADIDPGRVKVVGYGPTQPRFENDSREHRAKNRRVEIIIDLSNAPDESRLRLEDLAEDREGSDASSSDDWTDVFRSKPESQTPVW